MLDITASHITNCFIEEDGLLDWFGAELVLYHSKFAVTAYSDTLFQAFRIPFPDSMLKAVPKRRAEYLAGRYCAFRAFEQFGVHVSTIGIGESRNPLWPNGFIGSISHTNGRALAVVGRESAWLGVGIDIECIINQDTFTRIQNQILCEDERHLLSNNAEVLNIFTLCFSLKESFFKAVFPLVGYYFDFHAVSIVEIDREHNSIRFRLNQDLSPEFYRGLVLNGVFVLPLENTAMEKTVVTMVALQKELDSVVTRFSPK